ncbi:hypothetical protein [Vulcanisaeta sp. JCM 16159]|uniref:hypothetical protein n=1 Tax=Vulcanisaeta sp. JCM 16159 TaxID=1295371 RepID=UPI0006D0D452|nr:hypothetical protein [Vulcanisaeta sp. JCM 16159]
MTSNTLEVSNRLERVRAHLDRWLGAYVGLMIVLGLVAGYYSIGWVRYHEQLLNMVMMASIYIMIFPMLLMLNIRHWETPLGITS